MTTTIPYTDLCSLADKHGTDKRPEPKGHGYTHYYHSLFGERRDKVRKVLEIGIDVGASLRMWEEYFPNAKIYALDADPARFINKGRVRSFQCDQGNIESIRGVKFWLDRNFDFIIDDGSHVSGHQVASALELVPLLAPGGIYVIEDVPHPAEVTSQLPFPCEVHEFDIRRDPYSRLVVIHGR
jgi:predicted O-methyltransferase YrrM